MKLLEKLDRVDGSVRNRIKKLKLTGECRATTKMYTLEEDMLILDAAFEQYKEVKSLRNTNLPPVVYQSLSQDLKRAEQSISARWDYQLKVWLLGFYSKTLNMEVRLMLANLLAEKFETVSSIDWDQVKRYKEFSGQTVSSLRQLLSNDLKQKITQFYKVYAQSFE